MSAEPVTERIPVVRRGAAAPPPAAPPPSEPHPARRILTWAGGALVLVVVALAVAVAVVPAVGGATPLTVLSGSMEPALPVGSTVVVRPQPAGSIAAGDVITFTDRDEGSAETRVVTHRVIEVRPGPEFVTMGDANDTPDPGVVAAADVLGVQWYHVPYVGLLRERLLTPPGGFFAIGLVLVGVAVHLLVPRTRDAGGSRRNRGATGP